MYYTKISSQELGYLRLFIDLVANDRENTSKKTDSYDNKSDKNRNLDNIRDTNSAISNK